MNDTFKPIYCFFFTEEPGRTVFVSRNIFFLFSHLLILGDDSRSIGVFSLLHRFSQYISLGKNVVGNLTYTFFA